jgi:hypothetical protein
MAYPDLTATALRTSMTVGVSGPVAGANKLWLSVWSGETINAYDQYNVFEGLVEHKTLSGGVAYEFPVTGTIALTAAWNAGVELNSGTSSSSTIAVKLDKRPIAAHFEIDNIDLMQAQWEFRSELARQAGQTLANARDKQIAAYIARAGMEDAISSDPRGMVTGPVFADPTFKNLGATINAAAPASDRATAALAALKVCEDYVVFLQQNNVPTDGVYLAVTPRAFQDIRALGVTAVTNLTSVSMQPMFGGVAAAGGLGAPLSQGLNNLQDTLQYMGVTIMKSNHLPISNTVTTAANNIGEARYNFKGDEAGIVGMIFQKGCVASLKLQGMKVDTVDDVRRNTTFTVASCLNGTGVLRPECAALLIGATAQNSGTAGSPMLFVSGGASLNVAVDTAHLGGTESAVARGYLRALAVVTSEYGATTSGAFPYLNT